MKIRKRLDSGISRIEQIPLFLLLLRWIIISAVSGGCIGSASALLLVSLEWVTCYRENHVEIIALLPLAGLFIGLIYHYCAGSAVRGNNFLIEEIRSPRDIIPFRMAPLVYVGTVLTHLFGGSAGREGTGVQMGGAIADRFSLWLRMNRHDRRIMVLTGISAGFASVFGTPLAGAVFALEVVVVGRMRYEAILPVFLSAACAHLTCLAWGIHHTHYPVVEIPALHASALLWTISAAILFGLTAMLFSRAIVFWSSLGKRYLAYPPLRPTIAGIILAAAVWISGTTRYVGLGVPVIVQSFTEQQMGYDFLLKLCFTTFTIGMGFKGGEVTPLFFVGATLGSALSFFIPLPLSLLAALGFVAVFAGATNTPVACTLMGIELFGAAPGLYFGLACVVAYLFSGHTGIYTSQQIGSPKHPFYIRLMGRTLR